MSRTRGSSSSSSVVFKYSAANAESLRRRRMIASSCELVNLRFMVSDSRSLLQKLDEFLDAQARCSNQRSQGPNRQFLVLRNRKIRSDAGLRHHQVTTHLAHYLPAGFSECFGSIFPRNIAEASHLFSRS